LYSIVTILHKPARNHAPAGIIGVITTIEVSDDPFDFLSHLRSAVAAQAAIPSERALVVLGEGLGGLWTDTMQEAWRSISDDLHHQQRVAIVGATLPAYAEDGAVHFDNVAIAIGGTSNAVARQRIPVPFAMWRPWAHHSGFRTHWTESGILAVGDERLATTLCYEQMLVYPTLVSMVRNPSILVGLSNLRSFSGRSLSRWQHDAMRSWARLFDLPVVFAENRRRSTSHEEAR
jgi:apolipoprotein N-acyltransferase